MAERKRLQEASRRFTFRANTYYLGLINWEDLEDPIRRIIIPHTDELSSLGDAGRELRERVHGGSGLERRHEFNVVLLANNLCGGFCRFCFRKRLFMNDNEEVVRAYRSGAGVHALAPPCDQCTGYRRGSTSPVDRESAFYPHATAIHRSCARDPFWQQKMPAFNPYPLLDDPGSIDTLGEFSHPERRVYLMAHFQPSPRTDASGTWK